MRVKLTSTAETSVWTIDATVTEWKWEDSRPGGDPATQRPPHGVCELYLNLQSEG